MPQTVTAEDGTVHEFPDDATPEMIGQALGLGQQSPQVSAQGASVSPQGFSGRLPLDPNIAERGAILPLGRTTAGELEFAIPQIGVDIAESAMMPGRAAQGEPTSMKDWTEFALDFAIPALRGPAGTRMKTKPGKITRRMVKEAPTTKALRAGGSALFKKAEGSTAIIRPGSYKNALADMMTKMESAGYDDDLFPQVAASFRAISKHLGEELDMQDLMIIRQKAAMSMDDPGLGDNAVRMGMKMLDAVDDFVNNLSVDDVVSGTAEGVGKTLNDARKLWTQVSRTQDIDDIFDRALNQSSGFENGLRIGFRRLLDSKGSKRRYRGEERKAMENIVRGTASRNTLKRIGKMSYGTGQQANPFALIPGSAFGAGIGSTMGPAGAAAGAIIPGAIGYGAQRLGQRGTRLAAEKARAIAAGVRAPALPPKGVGTQFGQRAIAGQVPGMIGRTEALTPRAYGGAPVEPIPREMRPGLGEMTDDEREQWIINRRLLAAGGA